MLAHARAVWEAADVIIGGYIFIYRKSLNSRCPATLPVDLSLVRQPGQCVFCLVSVLDFYVQRQVLAVAAARNDHVGDYPGWDWPNFSVHSEIDLILGSLRQQL